MFVVCCLLLLLCLFVCCCFVVVVCLFVFVCRKYAQVFAKSAKLYNYSLFLSTAPNCTIVFFFSRQRQTVQLLAFFLNSAKLYFFSLFTHIGAKLYNCSLFAQVGAKVNNCTDLKIVLEKFICFFFFLYSCTHWRQTVQLFTFCTRWRQSVQLYKIKKFVLGKFFVFFCHQTVQLHTLAPNCTIAQN